MAQTIEQAIEKIGDRLERVIIPKLWRPTRAELRELSSNLSDLIVEGMGRQLARRLAEKSDLTPKDKRMAARRLVKSRIFGEVIPDEIANSAIRLVDLKREATQTVYQFTTESIGNVLNANSPDGISFKPKISKEELKIVENLLVDGLFYGESIKALMGPIPDRIRGSVLDSSIKFGRSTTATRDAVLSMRGMMNRVEKDLGRIFTNHMLAVDQQAEIDSRIPVG